MNAVEEKLYEIAGAEIATKNVNLGAWTKAFSVALGDEAKTKAVYIQLRVDQLREQLTAELQQRNESHSALRPWIFRVLRKPSLTPHFPNRYSTAICASKNLPVAHSPVRRCSRTLITHD